MKRTWILELLPFGRARAVPVDVAGELVSVGSVVSGRRSVVRRRLSELEQCRSGRRPPAVIRRGPPGS